MISFAAVLRRFFGTGDQEQKVDLKKMPAHVAIIMDGNGRWAQKRGLPRLAGHRAGSEAIRSVVRACSDLGISFLTLYTFSAENWRRPRSEVNGLMSLFNETLRAEVDELDRGNVRIKVIGKLDEINAATRESFMNAIDRTADNTGLTLTIALNYSGRSDIVNGVNSLIKSAGYGDGGVVDEAALAAALSTSGLPDPELVIRTSGELRLSNFLIWESAYSEFWVTDKLWPDFRRADLVKAVADYQRRGRRFGGL